MKKTVCFSAHAVNVFFHILTRCNLSCAHCYINPDQHGRRTLPAETAEKWLQVLAPQKKPANLILLGGEPTLHPDLPRIIRSARRLQYASITVDTNGFLFNDILSRTSPDQVDYFSFSLDGATRRTNDRIRGSGVYDVCVNGIRAAVSRGYHVSLIYTVSRLNIDELGAMADLVTDLGVQRLFIQVIGIRGKSARDGGSSLQLASTQWLKEIPPIAEKIARRGVTVSYPKVYLIDNEPFQCAGVEADNYFVFPNGRVYRCPLCEDHPVHSLEFVDDRLVKTAAINESDLFQLQIPEGCVMNRLIQPANIEYDDAGRPVHRIACCLLKEEISPPC